MLFGLLDSVEQLRHTRACRGYLAELLTDVCAGRGEIAATERGNDGTEDSVYINLPTRGAGRSLSGR